MGKKTRAGRKVGSKKTGGRKKGTPNKTTKAVKQVLEETFTKLDGVAAMTRWGKENPTEFYKLWVKMLPNEIKAEINADVNVGGNISNAYFPAKIPIEQLRYKPTDASVS